MNYYRVITLTIILLAFTLRLHNLTYHSLWFDEAVSVHWAKQSIPRILEVGFTLEEDRLPPLYYLMLKGWAALHGWHEFAVRSLAAFLGTLLVPVIMWLGHRLLNRPTALLSGLLVALNPFLIWYSQESRMYAPAVLFASLAIASYLNRKRRRWASAMFVLFATLSLYSHLYAGFLLPGLGLWLLLSYPRRPRLWLSFAAGGLLITLLYAPILRAIWRFSGEATPGDPLTGLTERAWLLLHSFTVWHAPLDSPWPTLIPLLIAGFALLAFWPGSTAAAHAPRHPRLLIFLLLLMPFVIANLLLARNYLAFFGERYFIVMVPWLLLLAAHGALRSGDWLQQWPPLRWLPALILILLMAAPLPGQWSVAAAKEGWRQSVAYLAEHAAPNHAILIHPDWVRYPFQYYFRGPGQTYAAFSNVGPETALDGPLMGVVGEHPVVWLIQSHHDGPDPQRRVEQWFTARYPLVTELYPPGIDLKGFAPGYQMEALPPTATPQTVTFANGLQLVGYQAEDNVMARDMLFHPPSGWLHVVLYWSTTTPITEPISPMVQLVGPQGVWGLSLPRATDALGLYPPERWQPGQIIRHDLDINLNPATPPGQYELQLVVGNMAYSLGHVAVR